MKKILLLSLLSFTLIFSCSKDDDENCNCGVITNDEINSDGDYTLSIRNSCSNNVETFVFTYDVWFNNYVGDEFCVTNVDSW